MKECECKPMVESNFTTSCWDYKKLKRTLVYHHSNSKKGFPIKGTNLRVSFEYI